MGLKGRKRLISKLRERTDRLVRAVALEAHGRLVRRTPVDIGRARANWNVGVGSPDRSVDEEATSEDISGKAAEARRKTLSEFGAGKSVFLTNGLPYISELEDGHSDQAPQGMIKVTAQELDPLTQRVAAEVARGLRGVTGGQ